MFWNTEVTVTAFIACVSMGLWIYWVMRLVLIVAGSEEEINRVLDSDLWWGRRFWLALRILLNPPSQLLSI
jgi:hypothetical protein